MATNKQTENYHQEDGANKILFYPFVEVLIASEAADRVSSGWTNFVRSCDLQFSKLILANFTLGLWNHDD